MSIAVLQRRVERTIPICARMLLLLSRSPWLVSPQEADTVLGE